MKGEPDCQCECCTYWRRHIHRVAADADKRTGRAKAQLNYHKIRAQNLEADCKRYAERHIEMWNENYRLKRDNEGGIFRKIFG